MMNYIYIYIYVYVCALCGHVLAVLGPAHCWEIVPTLSSLRPMQPLPAPGLPVSGEHTWRHSLPARPLLPSAMGRAHAAHNPEKEKQTGHYEGEMSKLK